MGVQVVARYVFNSSLSWSEELTRYLFVWSAFLSLPYTIKTNIALKIDQLFTVLPEGVKKVLWIIGYLLMFIFFIFMFKNSIGVVQSSMNSGQRSPALGLPMYLIQFSSLVGFGLAIIRTLQALILTIKAPIGKEEENCH
jgi:TRAP-type C4-dicarboxylate transport system permease small subunit